MRSFDACLAELHARPRYSKKKDLSRIRALLGALGEPQNMLRFVHVAGTNGKGSICAMTASVLREAGLRVGLYTSPYLVRFEERIQVCGEPIPQEAFCRLYEQVYAAQCELEALGSEPANEFEVTTAIGMLWFLEQKCDLVVLEVGLGGRLDATNVIEAQRCCCIGQIGLDHTAQLGSTIREVALEKAGIIKSGCTVITPSDQDPEAMLVFQQVCEARGAKLLVTYLPQEVRLHPDRTEFLYQGVPFSTALAGWHQASNAACAIEISRCLGLQDDCIQSGLQKTLWPGRLSCLSMEPAVVLDCAHNPHGVQALLTALGQIYAGKKPVVLMAMMQDKDTAACVQLLSKQAARIYATSLDMPRAEAAQVLCEMAKINCIAEAVENVEPALLRAINSLQPEEVLVICGSVYLAGEILRIASERPLFDKK